MTQADFVKDGLTLKAARVNAGFTQKEAAKMLDISEFTLANYENGKTYPDIRMLKKIEKLYNVPCYRIIFL
nr:MAG TPA: helix-turn-helix protein [Caudoviricetes sp.]